MRGPQRPANLHTRAVSAPRYLIFHKPYGVLCQFSGEGCTLQDYIPVRDVYPVGRLDKDSEGLVLLTDDGVLQHRLSDPKFAHPRTYCVQVEGAPAMESLQPLVDGGVVIQDYRTRPARVRILDSEPDFPPRDPPVRTRKSIPTAWIEITLEEGKNRQVRHMTAAVGFPTLRLVRTAIGKLRLDGLAAGEWREVRRSEI